MNELNSALTEEDRDILALLSAARADGRIALLIEALRAHIAAELQIQADAIDADASLVTLGLDSLQTLRLQSRLERLLGTEVPLSALWDQDLTALATMLAELLETRDGSPSPGASDALLPTERLARYLDQPTRDLQPPARESGPIPASSNQKRLWVLEQIEPSTARYHLHVGLRLHGALERSALERSLREIGRRHEILRTSLVVQDDELTQVVADQVDVELSVLDLGDLPGRDVEDALRRRSLEQARAPFNLAGGPLVRTSLSVLGPEEHVLFVTQHHAISDGWSLILLIRELFTLYDAFSRGLPSPLASPLDQYADVALRQRRWLAEPDSERQRTYWQRRLEGLPPLELPRSKAAARTARTANGATIAVHLPEALTLGLKALARRERTTLFTVLASALAVLLSRYTGQTDFGIGTVMANRGAPDARRVLGFFANTVVLRCDVGSNPSAATLLQRMHAVVLEAQEHQELPFDEVVRVTSSSGGRGLNPLIQACFVFESFPLPTGETSQMRWALLQDSPDGTVPGTAKFELGLTLADGAAGLWGALEYSTDLFEAPAMERLVGHFRSVLQGMVADCSQRVWQLPLLTEGERNRLLVEWNATAADVPTSCFPERFAAQVARTPDATAAIFEGRELTYRQLDEKASQVAHYLRSLGVGPDVVVGLFFERSFELVIGLLGVLKAGGAYVPLDPGYPHARLAFLLEDSGVRFVLTHHSLSARLPEGAARVLHLDTDEHLTGSPPGGGPRVDLRTGSLPSARPRDLAYVIYTSGSTGAPKGAANTHGGLTNRLHWMQKALALTSRDRVLHKTPIGFDVSVWELLWPLEVGAALVLAKPDGHADPTYLLELVETEQITTLHFVPSMLSAFLPLLDWGRCRSIKRVVCSGEELSQDCVQRFFSRSTAELYNLYGPTEASIDVTAFRCVPGAIGAVPIGRPIDNTALYVLDGQRELLPIGVPGELYLAGAGLARGYWRRPELTEERFVPNPFVPQGRMYRTGDLCRYREDGNLEFLGRLDHQVKIRGHRIEPGEIEASLARHPAVSACVVVAREDWSGDKRLVAYAVSKETRTTSTASLREHLQAQLPEVMVPSAFVWLESLPLTPSGKVDRKALPAPVLESPREGYVAPRTPTEERLAGLFAELLHVDRVGRHDDFFALGGDSLLAVQAIRMARDAGLDVGVQQLFEHPNVADLAARSVALAGSRALEPAVAPRSGDDAIVDSYPLTQMQASMLVHALEPPPGVGLYHFQMSLRLDEPRFATATFARALDRIVRRYPTLRTMVVTRADGSMHQVVRRTLDVKVGEENLVGLTPAEQDARVERHFELDRAAPFQPSGVAEPLFRAKVFRRSPDQVEIFWSICHLIVDGWGNVEFWNQLFAEYWRLLDETHVDRPVVEAPNVFKEFVALEAEIVASADAARYWGRPSAARLAPKHPDGPRAVIDRAGDLSGDLTAALRRQVGVRGVSAKSICLSALVDVLCDELGACNATIGVVSNGRSEILSDPLHALGLFWNILPFCGGRGEAVERIHRRLLEAQPFERYPLAEIVKVAGGEPFFLTLNFTQFHDAGEWLVGSRVLDVKTYDVFHFPLNCAVHVSPRGDRARLRFTADARFFEAADVQRIARRYEGCLRERATE